MPKLKRLSTSDKISKEGENMYKSKEFRSHRDLVRWLNENYIDKGDVLYITKTEEGYTLFYIDRSDENLF